jgi:hypothetical protein
MAGDHSYTISAAKRDAALASVPGLLTKVLVVVIALITLGTPSSAEPEAKAASPQETVKRQPNEAERESWRQRIMQIPRPKNGCFAATYPEPKWREVPCTTPPHEPHLPKGAMTGTGTIGGTGTDFSAAVTSRISEAEGSFDSVVGVTNECSVPCPNGICPTDPTCPPNSENQYTLQLNTNVFTTQTCSGSPNPVGCRGWEQFFYDSRGFGFIQYWLINFGPPGAACPMPRGAKCVPGGGLVFSDGWCPFPVTTGPFTTGVNCAINSEFSMKASLEPITSLGQLKLTGAVAGVAGETNDLVSLTNGSTILTASGSNRFPDLGSQWQIAEFNVFGLYNGSQAVFNPGSTIAVRTGVASFSPPAWRVAGSGTLSGPFCNLITFTAESNNLTLVNTSPTAVKGTLPALLFTESNVPASRRPGARRGVATCAGATTSVIESHGAWQLLSNLDLAFIKTDNTRDGQVEVHTASRSSNYQDMMHFDPTAFVNETDGVWQLLPNLDLAFIKTEPQDNTPNAHVEVHIASRASNYQDIMHFEPPTAFVRETDGVWQLLPNLDLAFIKTGNTPNGHVEVHIASRASNYQDIMHFDPTAFVNETNGVWQLLPNLDLVFIKTGNTRDERVEVHIASRDSNYQEIMHFEPPTTFVNETDGVWQLLPNLDLAFIKTNNTPNGHVEVHIASRASTYQERIYEEPPTAFVNE